MYAILNVVWPADAVKVCLVLSVGNDAQVTPVPTVFRYCPFDPVPPPAVIVLSNFTLPSNSAWPTNVDSPVAFRLRTVRSGPIKPLPGADTILSANKFLHCLDDEPRS